MATKKKSSKAPSKPAAAKRPAAAPQPAATEVHVQETHPDKGVVTDDAGRPETHDNFGDEDTGEE